MLRIAIALVTVSLVSLQDRVNAQATVPPAPTNLVAVTGFNAVTLTWNPVSTATSYNVKRSTSVGGPYTTIATGVASTNYADPLASPGTAIYYVVSGVNGHGEGANSKPASALQANFLKANGCDLRDQGGTGQVVALRGVNLGGWLYFEGWMCPATLGTNSNALEFDVWTNFISRFGQATTDTLLDTWRANWITTNDLDVVASAGMNLVRCPFSFDTFQSQPELPSVLLANVSWRPDAAAFKHLDWLVRECARRNIYVVFDHHHPEGLDDETLYQTPAYIDRFVHIWQRIASRYAGNPTVVGYDIVNESYGDPNRNAVWNSAYQAIRAVDPDHCVIVEYYDIPSAVSSINTYGWQNVLSSTHDYWNSWVSISNALGLERAAPPGTTVCPSYVGEFMDGGTGVPRIPYYNDSGAPWTAWTLKTVDQRNWSMFNADFNGPQANTNYVPDLLNDPAPVIASKWSLWRTPPAARVNFGSSAVNAYSGPVARNAAYVLPANGSLAITANMLLTNVATLNQLAQLALTNVAAGRTGHGVLSATANGYLYQPDAGFEGLDAFTYQAVDQRLHLSSLNPGTVSLNVGVPPTPVGLSAQNGAGVVNLTWQAAMFATGYNVKRATVSGGPYSLLASGITSAAYADTNVFTCQPYFYAVSATDPGYESPNSSEAFGQATGSLPPQFQTANVGAVGPPGNAYSCGGVFTVAGSGSDIWGTADSFRFVYASLTGDGEIRARVASVANTDAWAKAGVMIRENLTAGARNVCQVISYGNGSSFQSRASAGGSSYSAGNLGLAPYWVRLTRTNNTFAGYISPDGINWTVVGSTNISMAASVYGGLAVTAHNNSLVNLSVLDNVTASFITNLPPAVQWVAPTNGAVFIQPNAVSLTVAASDADGTVTNVAFYNGASLLGAGSTGHGNTYSLTWSNVPVGNLTLSAVASDNLSATNVPATAMVTVQPLTLTIVSGTATNGPITLSFSGQTGQSYIVEVSTNLTNWSPLQTNTATAGALLITDTNTSSPQRFYRLRQ